MVVTDGVAAPTIVNAPAPDAPANILPITDEPLLTVAVRPASMLPFQVVPDPMVISRPATNQMFLAWAPLASLICVGRRSVPESTKELSTLMIKTAFASFCASNVVTVPAAKPSAAS